MSEILRELLERHTKLTTCEAVEAAGIEPDLLLTAVAGLVQQRLCSDDVGKLIKLCLCVGVEVGIRSKAVAEGTVDKPKFEFTQGELNLANLAARSIPAKDWWCRAEGREPHRRILHRHPKTGLRQLFCPDCQSEEVRAWLSTEPDYDSFELSVSDREFLAELKVGI